MAMIIPPRKPIQNQTDELINYGQTVNQQTDEILLPQKKPIPVKKPLKNWRDSKIIQAIISENPIIGRIINKESRGDPNAQNEISGARGLMQITKDTAEGEPGFNVDWNLDYDELFDPELNVQFGTDYYLGLKKYYGNDKEALIAYNWGHGNYQSFKKLGYWIDKNKIKHTTLPEETQGYIKEILEE